MANRERGELRIELDGRAVVMRLTLNAMCAIEARLQEEGRAMPFPEFAARLKFAYMRDVRLFVWGALLDAQPKLTIEDAGRFIDAAGGVGAFVEQHLQPLIRSAEPDPEDLQAIAGRADPQRAAHGTGDSWSSMRGAQASGARPSGGSRFANFFGRWRRRRPSAATGMSAT